MKFSLVILLGVVSAFAQAGATTIAINGSVGRYLPNIIDRVSQCSVLPYSLNSDGQKTYHEIVSHCPEVKVVSPGHARIKVAGHTFNANLTEAYDSDGDFYDVNIQDVATGETQVISNVAAYGDILLGVLSGDTAHVSQIQVVLGLSADLDSNLLH